MLYNELYEAGQNVSLCESSITNREFKRLVLLIKPTDSPFIHKYNSESYTLQEWKFKNPDDSIGHTYFCLGKANPLHADENTVFHTFSDFAYTFSLFPSSR